MELTDYSSKPRIDIPTVVDSLKQNGGVHPAVSEMCARLMGHFGAAATPIPEGFALGVGAILAHTAKLPETDGDNREPLAESTCLDADSGLGAAQVIARAGGELFGEQVSLLLAQLSDA